MSREYQAAIEREVGEWPGVSVSFEHGGKHPRAVFALGDDSQFHPYPSTPSDFRGLRNCIRQVRSTLTELGATRNERRKSTRPRKTFNPGADMRERNVEPAPVIADPWEPLRSRASAPLVTTPGAYPHISNEDYHGREICPAPSISSTGLKKLVSIQGMQTKGCTPRHYWEGSPLNPNRRPQAQTDALRLGSAFHDALLLPERYADRNCYHVTPEGFSRAKTKAMAGDIADADAAIEAGCTIISAEERDHIDAMVAAMRGNPLADALLSDGKPEVTLAWQDAETGVWLRCRPDWLRDNLSCGINVKTAADASFAGFQSDVTKYRYFMSAALELDGIEAIYGKRPPLYVHPVVEKNKGWQPGDYIPVALWALSESDLEYGRTLNRRAIRTFADCLSADRWPGYADAPAECGLAGYARRQIDDAIEREAA